MKSFEQVSQTAVQGLTLETPEEEAARLGKTDALAQEEEGVDTVVKKEEGSDMSVVETVTEEGGDERKVGETREPVQSAESVAAAAERENLQAESEQKIGEDRVAAERLVERIKNTGNQSEVPQKETKVDARVSQAGVREQQKSNAQLLEDLKGALVTDPKMRDYQGGLYEEEGKILADFPRFFSDKSGARKTIDDLGKRTNSVFAKALEALWDKGDPLGVLSELASRQGKFSKDYSRIKGLDMSFLRGDEYANRVRNVAEESYTMKERREADYFRDGAKKAVAVGAAGASVGAGGAALVVGLQSGIFLGASTGFIVGAVPVALGYGAWRLYKHFKNKSTMRRQLESLEKL